MTFTSHDPATLVAQAQRMVEEAKEKAALMAEVVGTGEDEEGNVTVTVFPTGTLKEITLDPRAMRMPSVDLAAAIVACARLAEKDAQTKVRQIWGDAAATGGFDFAAAAQGKLDLAAELDSRMAKAKEALNRIS